MTKIKDRVFIRSIVLFSVFTLFFGYFSFKIIKIQYFSPELKQTNQPATPTVENRLRGDILSTDGELLGGDFPKYDILVDFKIDAFAKRNATVDTTGKILPEKVRDRQMLDVYRVLSRALAKFVGEKPANEYFDILYNYRLKADRASDTDSFLRTAAIASRINIFQHDSIFGALKTMPFFYRRSIRYAAGIYREDRFERIYPYGNLAHSTLGVLKGDGSKISLSGIENLCDDELKQGNHVISTIDVRMQDICETILRNSISLHGEMFTSGTVVIMDVPTGDIKAMANFGQFSDTRYRNRTDVMNNAIHAAIDPGSTFKTVSLMLALETGKVKISDEINYDRGTVMENGKRRWENVTDIATVEAGKKDITTVMRQSLNIGTAKFVHQAFGYDWKSFRKAILKTGILDSLGLTDAKTSVRLDNKNDMFQVSHGYQVNLTPLHILTFYNAIANRGAMMKPRIVRGTVDKSGDTKLEKPVLLRKICSTATADSLAKLLSDITRSGTRYGISGKTGTAQIYLSNSRGYTTGEQTGRDLVSFCGYFPFDKPRYSCIVVLYSSMLKKEELGRILASNYAVPVFRSIADAINALSPQTRLPETFATRLPDFKNTSSDNIRTIGMELNQPYALPDGKWMQVTIDTAERQPVFSKMEIGNNPVPDVRGMGLRDAVYILENAGFRTSYSGTGKVIAQSRTETSRTVRLELK
ncbi:MAG: PASTA domain-containing protein [Prevotellaceae bacterium]|jgi:cell division protein FtsI (penicillin-binding protein 3)|nr:PASTA domain-containing protein [Prevotellaceae bacterium]